MIKAKAGPVTLLVMLACSVIFVMQQLGAGNAVFSMLHFPAFTGQEWQLWRWISHALLHFSVMHIAFNLLWWWQLGGDIEQRLRYRKTDSAVCCIAALYLGAGQYWVEGRELWRFIWGSLCVSRLPMDAWLQGAATRIKYAETYHWFYACVVSAWFMQPFMAIANTAHLVGFLSGVAIGFIRCQSGQRKRGKRYKKSGDYAPLFHF